MKTIHMKPDYLKLTAKIKFISFCDTVWSQKNGVAVYSSFLYSNTESFIYYILSCLNCWLAVLICCLKQCFTCSLKSFTWISILGCWLARTNIISKFNEDKASNWINDIFKFHAIELYAVFWVLYNEYLPRIKDMVIC